MINGDGMLEQYALHLYGLLGLCIWWVGIRLSYTAELDHNRDDYLWAGMVCGALWPVAVILLVCALPIVFIDWASNKKIF